MADLSIALAPGPVAAPKADAPAALRASKADDSQGPDPFAKLMAGAKAAKAQRPQHVAQKADKDAKPDETAADRTDEDKDEPADETSASDDPLGDAISAGLTAVLALAQPLTPAPVSQAAASASADASPTLVLPGLPAAPAPSTTQAATPSPAAMDAAQQALAAFVAAANGSKDDAAADSSATTADGDTKQAPQSTTPPAGAAKAAQPANALPAAASAIAALADDAKGAVPRKIEAKAAETPAPVSGKNGADTAPAVPTMAHRLGEPTQPGTQPGRFAHAGSRKTGDGGFTIAAFGAQTASAASGLVAADPTAVAAQSPADIALQQQLDVAQDGQWLDRLAKDIAGAAGSGQDLNFRLSPQNLGTLAVSIAQGADGAAVRLTTDSADTRQLLIDSQPRLVAEARAQGLKISETRVDLNNNQQQSGSNPWGQNSHSSNPQAQGQSAGQQQRQPLPDRQPFSSNPTNQADSSDPNGTADSDALYA